MMHATDVYIISMGDRYFLLYINVYAAVYLAAALVSLFLDVRP